ncbi:MAG: thiamine pyrophosphate-binding protein [Xanthobacteraceae bacterium]|nr:thiamine pyrophosphate-binding protein [Xanthobacteraceae bacterium]
MASTAEVLAEAFEQAGTPFIVGHPGGESVELMEAARARGMRFLLTKQESAGAILAATWGEITGAPGVCLSTRGPGATNMVNGVAYAALDRAPLIAITDQYPAPVYATSLRQRVDQLALYAPLVKWGTTIDARTVRQQVRRAIRVATEAPPGPVPVRPPGAGTPGPRAGRAPPPPPRAPRAGRRPRRRHLLARAPARRAGRAPARVPWWASGPASPPPRCAAPGRFPAPLRAPPLSRAPVPERPSRERLVCRGRLGRAEAAWLVPAGRPRLARPPPPAPRGPGALRPRGRALSVPRPRCAGGGRAPRAARPPRPSRRRGAARAPRRAAPGRRRPPPARPGRSRPPWPPSRARAPALARARAPALRRGTAATAHRDPGPRAAPCRILPALGHGGCAPHPTLRRPPPGPPPLRARARPPPAFLAAPCDGGLLVPRGYLMTVLAFDAAVIVLILDDHEVGVDGAKGGIGSPGVFACVTLGGLDWGRLAAGFGADGTLVETEHALGDALAAALKSGRTTVIAARVDPSGYVAQFNALREI